MYLCSICNCFLAYKSDEIYKYPLKEGEQLKYILIELISFLTFKIVENCKED